MQKYVLIATAIGVGLTAGLHRRTSC